MRAAPRGFTLLEVIVVLAIAAIAYALVVGVVFRGRDTASLEPVQTDRERFGLRRLVVGHRLRYRHDRVVRDRDEPRGRAPRTLRGGESGMSEPTIELAMPPPSSPVGAGMCVKKAMFSDCTPWLTTKKRTNASGTSASSTDAAQNATKNDEISFRDLVPRVMRQTPSQAPLSFALPGSSAGPCSRSAGATAN